MYIHKGFFTGEKVFVPNVILSKQTTEKAIIRKEKHLEEDTTEDEEVIYKIEVAANR